MKWFLTLVTVISSFAVVATADEMSAAQARIQARQREVATLKESGALGENNRGFLEVRGSAAGAGQLAQQENADREILYGVVAKRSNVPVEQVGRERAKSIAASSKSGVWVQDEGGAWKKK